MNYLAEHFNNELGGMAIFQEFLTQEFLATKIYTTYEVKDSLDGAWDIIRSWHINKEENKLIEMLFKDSMRVFKPFNNYQNKESVVETFVAKNRKKHLSEEELKEAIDEEWLKVYQELIEKNLVLSYSADLIHNLNHDLDTILHFSYYGSFRKFPFAFWNDDNPQLLEILPNCHEQLDEKRRELIKVLLDNPILILDTVYEAMVASFFDSPESPRFIRGYSQAILKDQRHNEPIHKYVKRLFKKAYGVRSKWFRYLDSVFTDLSKVKSLPSKTHYLVLSVDPRDFVTASRGENWSSCYALDSDYASSVTSVMMAPDTIIAYIISEEDYNTMQENKYYVPNKKWRSFIAANEKAVVFIKQYPFFDPGIYKDIHKWLNKLTGFDYKFCQDDWTRVYIDDDLYGSYYYSDIENVLGGEEYSNNLGLRTEENKDWISLTLFTEPRFWDTGEEFQEISAEEFEEYEVLTSNPFKWKALEGLVNCEECGAYLYDNEDSYNEEHDCYYCVDCSWELNTEAE